MNRDDLDAFFAKAEDVLTDWHGDTDSMHARVPERDPDLAMAGDSYYAQTPFGGYRQRWVSPQWLPEHAHRPTRAELNTAIDLTPLIMASAGLPNDLPARVAQAGRAFAQAMHNLTEQASQSGSAFAEMFSRFTLAEVDALADSTESRDRALAARRNRNTGPVSRVGLDGRKRR